MTLHLQPISWQDACTFVQVTHRHHQKPQGWKFGIAAVQEGRIVGVVMVGRPVARAYDDGFTLEVTRLATDGTKNACSFLYSAAWRAVRAMGYRRLVTYTLPQEGGASLRATGWRVVHQTRGDTWDRPSRPRTDKHPTGPKTLWEMTTDDSDAAAS